MVKEQSMLKPCKNLRTTRLGQNLVVLIKKKRVVYYMFSAYKEINCEVKAIQH